MCPRIIARQTKTRRILYPLQQSLHLHQSTHATRNRLLHTQRGQGVAIFYTSPFPYIPLPDDALDPCSHVSTLRGRVRNTRPILLLSALVYICYGLTSSSFTTTARRQLWWPWSWVRRVCVRARAPPSTHYVWVRRSDCRPVDGRTTPETHTATPVVNTKERPLQYHSQYWTGTPTVSVWFIWRPRVRVYKCCVVCYASSVHQRTFPFPPTRLFMYYVDDDVKMCYCYYRLNYDNIDGYRFKLNLLSNSFHCFVEQCSLLDAHLN